MSSPDVTGRYLPFGMVASTSAVAWSGSGLRRCRCHQCLNHDVALENRVAANALRFLDDRNRRRNYLEPFIRRMDHHIETLRRLDA